MVARYSVSDSEDQYISRMFLNIFPEADFSTSFNRHLRNFTTCRGCVGNRSTAIGLLKCPLK